jgi:hypothetical protein
MNFIIDLLLSKHNEQIYDFIIINSYSLWHRFETTHTKNAIYITERKILKRKKNSSTLIQSLSQFLDDVVSFKCRMNDVFALFIRCFFQY